MKSAGNCFSHLSACAVLNSAAVKPRSSPFLTQRYQKMITGISAIVRSLLSFASLESSNCSGFRYSLIVISDDAWIITWMAFETKIRFSYASVPPLLKMTMAFQRRRMSSPKQSGNVRRSCGSSPKAWWGEMTEKLSRICCSGTGCATGTKPTASRRSAPPRRTTTKMSFTTMSCRRSGRSR